MNRANVAWWTVYTCLGVGLQTLFPGLDFLLPGLVLAIQERDTRQVFWLIAFFLLLQEGMGNMAFGGTLLWYMLTVASFFLGYSLFEVESFLFIFLLSGWLGAAHLGVFLVMADLQDIPVNVAAVMEESVIQALLTPFVWRLARLTRKVRRNEDSV
jgi:hypothetical protein